MSSLKGNGVLVIKSRIDKLEYTNEISDGNSYYYKNNKYHRDKDLPAYVGKDSSRVWIKNGLRHRDNGKPSGIFSNGEMHWYENGIFIKDNLDEIKNR